MPIIALSSMISPEAIERGRKVGFHDYVAKFDRPGLIAALKEQTAESPRGVKQVQRDGKKQVRPDRNQHDQQDRSTEGAFPNTSPR